MKHIFNFGFDDEVHCRIVHSQSQSQFEGEKIDFDAILRYKHLMEQLLRTGSILMIEQ